MTAKGIGFVAGDFYYHSSQHHLCARDRHTGALAWSFAGEEVFWPPFVSDGHLYVSSADGTVQCWKPAAAKR